MGVSEILNLLLGGGLVATLAGLLSLRATLREAVAKAEAAQASAETVKITNTESATRILVSNIVEPLKTELHATREELSSYKKEMARLLSAQKRELARLRKAIEGANSCDYRDWCPVLERMRDEKTDDTAGDGEVVIGQYVPDGDAGATPAAGDGPGITGDVGGSR